MNLDQQGERILRDRESLIGITTVLSEDPDRVRLVASLVEKNPNVKRFAQLQQADRRVQKAAGGISASDKRFIAKTYNAGNNQRQTSGVECIVVLPNRCAKKSFYPVKDKLTGYIAEMLTDEIGYLYKTDPDRSNKNATTIIGKSIYGNVYFFRKSGNGELINLTKDEFEKRYTGIVSWK